MPLLLGDKVHLLFYIYLKLAILSEISENFYTIEGGIIEKDWFPS